MRVELLWCGRLWPGPARSVEAGQAWLFNGKRTEQVEQAVGEGASNVREAVVGSGRSLLAVYCS